MEPSLRLPHRPLPVFRRLDDQFGCGKHWRLSRLCESDRSELSRGCCESAFRTGTATAFARSQSRHNDRRHWLFHWSAHWRRDFSYDLQRKRWCDWHYEGKFGRLRAVLSATVTVFWRQSLGLRSAVGAPIRSAPYFSPSSASSRSSLL